MFKLIKIGFFTLMFVLTSCSANIKSDSVDEAELIMEYPAEIKSFVSMFPLLKLDYSMDKKFLEDTTQINKKQLLTLNQVKLLAKSLAKDDFTDVNEYYLKDYYEIEQHKVANTYQEFVDKLDIGMMQDISCSSIGKIEFGDSISVLFWKIKFSSYPACPFYQGTNVLATIISDKKVVQTLQVSCEESSGDAPFSSTIYQKMKLDKKGKLVTNSESLTFEEDKEIEHFRDIIEYKLSKKGFLKK